MSTPGDRRGEDGAIAIMVAMLSLVLFAIAALAVDLGNAFVHKRDIQKTADFAALAGAGEDNLPMTAAGGTCSYGARALAADQAMIDVAAYLSRHYSTPVTAADLRDCDVSNGEAGYGQFNYNAASATWTLVPNKNQISVISQQDKVDYGFARLLGFNSVQVKGAATVEIKSPLMRTLPFYAKDACSWGNQTIAQPPNGQASGLFLYAPHDTNAARINTLTTDPAT